MKQKIVSLGLVLMLLLNLAFPDAGVFAEEVKQVQQAQLAEEEEYLVEEEEETEGEETASQAAAEVKTELLPRSKAPKNLRAAKEVSDKLENLKLTVLQNGIPVPENGTIDVTKPIKINLQFGFPVEGDGKSDPVQKGDWAQVKLGKELNLKEGDTIELIGPKIPSLDDKVAKVGHVKLIKEGEEVVVKIIFDGDEEVYNGTLHEVTAQFTAELEVMLSGGGTGGSTQEIAILGKTYKVEVPEGIRFSLTKKGEAKLNERIIEWTITVKAEDVLGNLVDLKDYILLDNLNEAGVYKANTFKVNGQSVSPLEGNEELRYTFPIGSKGLQTIVFQTILKEKEAAPKKPLTKKNKVQLLDKGQKRVAEARAEVTINPEAWIYKWSMKENKKEKTFDWAIDINRPKRSLKNVVITDGIREGMTFVKARAEKGYWINHSNWKEWKATEIIKTWDVKPNDDKYYIGDIQEEIFLVITVKVEQSEEEISRTLWNKASVEWEDSEVFEASAQFRFIFGKNNNIIEKKGEGRNWENAGMKWRIKIEKETLKNLKNPRVYDLMIFDRSVELLDSYDSAGNLKNPSGVRMLTLEDDAPELDMNDLVPRHVGWQKYLPGSFQSKTLGLEAKTYKVFKGSDYVGDLIEVSGSDLSQDWEFNLESVATERYHIQRTSPTWLSNTANLFDGVKLLDKAIGDNHYKPRLLEKELLTVEKAKEFKEKPTAELANAKTKEKTKGFDYNDHTVIYRISINGDNHKYLHLNMGTMELKDILPEGWEFVKINDTADYLVFSGETINYDTNDASVKAKGNAISAKANDEIKSLGWNASDFIGQGTAKITFNKNLEEPYVIFLAAKPTEAKLKEYLTEKGSAVNKAIFKGTKSNEDMFRTQEVEFDLRVLNKNVHSLGGVLEWTINYNPQNLSISADNVSLEDTLSVGMELRTNPDGSLALNGNFYLYEIAGAMTKTIPLTEGKDISYDKGSRVLTLNLPDKQKEYRFVYLTDVTGVLGQVLSNIVKLKGSTITAQPEIKHYQIASIDASANYKLNALIEIQKVNKDNEPLAGAEFTLTLEDGTSLKAITGTTGLARFNRLPAGTHTLKETKAPEGYQIEDKVYIVKVEKKSDVDVKVFIADVNTKKITITNQKKIEKTQLTVMKKWHGKVLGSVTVYLMKNDVKQLPGIVLNKDNNWTHTFKDLEKKDGNGKNIIYTTQEDVPEGYILEMEMQNNDEVIILHNTEKITIPVEKKWVGPAKASVEVELLRDGKPMQPARKLTLKADADPSKSWKGSFENLPRYEQKLGSMQDTEIKYEVVERNMPTGYESKVEGTAERGFTITNTNTEKVSVPVEKRWVGPEAGAIEVQLLENGQPTGKELKISAPDWRAEFKDLPRYVKRTGSSEYVEAEYSVKEVNTPASYEAKISKNPAGGFIITNTNIQKIAIPVIKRWIGAAADRVTFRLFADGVELVDKAITLTKDNLNPKLPGLTPEPNCWYGVFEDLLRYDSKTGKEIKYTFKEDILVGYETIYWKWGTSDKEVAQEAGELVGTGWFEITNRNLATRDIQVIKSWQVPAGTVTPEVTMVLYRDGVATGQSLLLNAGNGWKAEFKNLPVYDPQDGHKIKYEVKENAVAGYNPNPAYTGQDTASITVTNTIVGKVSVGVTKEWIGAAANSVTIRLLANGVEKASQVLNAANKWQHTFADLDQYDAAGQEIVYTIKEDAIAGYKSRVDSYGKYSFHVVNLNEAKIDIPVTKKWIGPEKGQVIVKLLADGVERGTMSLSASNGWKASFTGLAKYSALTGEEIRYTVEEVKLTNYEAKITGNMATGFTITNTNTETLDVSFTKKWVGNVGREITVDLLQNGKAIANVTLSRDVLGTTGTWAYTFIGLPKYNSATGEAYVYTLSERYLSWYVATITGDVTTGFIITNTEETPPTPYDPPGGEEGVVPPPTTPTTPGRPTTPDSEIPNDPTPEGNTTIGENPVPEGNTTTPEVPFEDEIPQGVPELPKTAGIPFAVFGLLGLALAGAGLLLKRK